MFSLFKHAKNFVGNESRPIFQGIYFDGERAIVTNTQIMVIDNNLKLPKQLVHYKTGEQINGQFPDCNKAIPKEPKFNVSYANIEEFIRAVKVAKSLHDRNSEYGPMISLEGLFLSSKNNNLIFTAKLAGDILDKPNQETFFNGKYLYDVLNWFKDDGVETVKIGFNGPLNPMLLTTDKGLMAVISPIRTKERG